MRRARQFSWTWGRDYARDESDDDAGGAAAGAAANEAARESTIDAISDNFDVEPGRGCARCAERMQGARAERRGAILPLGGRCFTAPAGQYETSMLR